MLTSCSQHPVANEQSTALGNIARTLIVIMFMPTNSYCSIVCACQTFCRLNLLAIQHAWPTSESRIPLFTISNARRNVSDRIRGLESRPTGHVQCLFIGRLPFVCHHTRKGNVGLIALIVTLSSRDRRAMIGL